MKTLQLKDDNDMNAIGSVTSIRENEVYVDWNNGKKGKYKYSHNWDGSDDSNVREVSIVDPSVSGIVFIKNLLSRPEANGNDSSTDVTCFGLNILANGLLSVFFRKGKELYEYNSVSKLSSECFSHLMVTIGEHVTLYINGASEVSENMEKISTTPLFLDRSSFFIGQPPSSMADKHSFDIGMSGLIGNIDVYCKHLETAAISEIYEGLLYCITLVLFLISSSSSSS
jgi:hypothetical protein